MGDRRDQLASETRWVGATAAVRGGWECWGAGGRGGVGKRGRDKFGARRLKRELKPTLGGTTGAQMKMEELHSEPAQVGQRKMARAGHFSAPDLTISLGCREGPPPPPRTL